MEHHYVITNNNTNTPSHTLSDATSSRDTTSTSTRNNSSSSRNPNSMSSLSLLSLNDELLVSIFLWLLDPEELIYRHLVLTTTTTTTTSDSNSTTLTASSRVHDNNNNTTTEQEEQTKDNNNSEVVGDDSPSAPKVPIMAAEGNRSGDTSTSYKGMILNGREVLRSLCIRIRKIIDSLCNVLSVRLKDIMDTTTTHYYQQQHYHQITATAIPCLSYIFDFTGIHSTSIREPLNAIVNFINSTSISAGHTSSSSSSYRTRALLMPPARVHLLNINPWMFEPSNRCIRDVFGVVRDVEENSRGISSGQLTTTITTAAAGNTSFDNIFRRRIEVVRMTLTGFMIHQQEVPPLKVTLANIRLLSLTYCTFPFTPNALPDSIRQVPWMPSMPVLDRLELRHMMAMNTPPSMISGITPNRQQQHLDTINDINIIIIDALLEGIVHRIPSLTTLLIDSSSSITNPNIPSNAINLKYLTLSHCPRIMPMCVEKVLRECKYLKMLDIRTLTHLANEIHTDCMGNIETLWLPSGVKEEYLSGILSHGHTKCVKYLGISEIEDINLSAASPTLETLSINRSERMPLPNISSFTITPQQHLERLSITFCRFDTARFRVNGTFSNLKILSLQNVVYSHTQLSLLLSSTPFLTALDIALCDQTTTLPNNQQQRQRDPNSAARDDLEPLRVPGTSNPAIPVKFPYLKYLCLSGSKKIHYSAIVPSIISNANILEHLKLLKIRPVYSIRSPSSHLSTVMISLLPPLPSTRVRLVRDILSEPTAVGERLLLDYYSKRSEVDLFIAALTNQCWNIKSLVLSGSGSSYYDTSISNGIGNTTRLLQEYELFTGAAAGCSSSDISYLPSTAATGGDMRMRSVRDSVNDHYNTIIHKRHRISSQMSNDHSSPSSSWAEDGHRHHQPHSQESMDSTTLHETYDTAMVVDDDDDNCDSDDSDDIDNNISSDDSIMLDVMIELTIAIALGLIARIVAVNEIIHSSYNIPTNQRNDNGEGELGNTIRRVRISRPSIQPDTTLDGNPLHDDDDMEDDDDDDTPMLVLPSPTAVTPPSPGDIMGDDDIMIPPPPPPSISVAPHPPPLRSIQQLIIMHRMPMSGLELDAPPGSIEWDAYYRETMAILMSAPVRTTFNILSPSPNNTQEDNNRVSSGSVEAKHKAVYEYGKAYESMLGRYNSMKTAQAAVMTQLPDRQQEQMLWKGLLIQATGIYPTEGAYSSKIISHRKTLLRYKESPNGLGEYLKNRRAINIELAGLLYRRFSQIPHTDRWGARCRPTEDRENDIITGCLRNALTPAGVIGGGIAVLPLREGSCYLPKLFDNIPVHLMAPLLVNRLTSSSLLSSSMITTTIEDVGLMAQYSEVMEMCISMHIQFDTIELKQPGYHIVQTAIAEANAKDKSTRGPLPALPVEIQDNLSLIRVAVAMVTTGKAELEARSRSIEEAIAQRRKTAKHRLLMSLVYGRLIKPLPPAAGGVDCRLETLSLDTLIELLRISVNEMAISLYRLRSGKVYGNIIERVSHTSITNPPWWSRSLEAMKLKYPALTNLSKEEDVSEDGDDDYGYQQSSSMTMSKLEAFKDIRSKFPNLVVLQVELPEPTLSQLHHLIRCDNNVMNSTVKSNSSKRVKGIPPGLKLTCRRTDSLPRVNTLPSPYNTTVGEDAPPASKKSRLTYNNSSSDGATPVSHRLERVASDASVATTTRLSQIEDGDHLTSDPNAILHFNSVDTEWYRTTQCTTVKEDMMKLEWQQCDADRDLAIN